jgi:hypothetical protein
MSAFLRGKGQIIWDVVENTSYLHPINFLAPGSRDMHNVNNKVVDYIFHFTLFASLNSIGCVQRI